VIFLTQNRGTDGDDAPRRTQPLHSSGGNREDQMPGINDRALRALTRAWITTVIATGLLCAALAIAPMWDSAGYLRALPGALSLGQ
jgi:hypothetical protein